MMREVINAATALLAEAVVSGAPERGIYYRAKAYLNQKADKKAMDDLQLLAKDTRTLMELKPNIWWHYNGTTPVIMPLQKRKSLISSTKAHRMPTGWHAVSSFCLMYM